jgi:hypothetical protein
LADQEVARRKRPVAIPAVQVRDDYLADNQRVGDTINVTLAHGWIQQSGTFRVAWLELDPTQNDLLTIGLNLP